MQNLRKPNTSLFSSKGSDSKEKYKPYWFFISTMIGIWIFIQLITLIKNYQIYQLYDEPIEWTNILIPRIISFLIGLVFLAAVWGSSHIFIRRRFSFIKSIISHIIMAFGLSFFMYCIVFFLLNWLQIEQLSIESLFKFYLIEIDRSILIYLLFASFVYAFEYIHGYRMKSSALKKVKAHQDFIQAHALTQEIDPHLMSNYLSGINSLIQHAPEKATQMIKALADWTRGHLGDEEVWISLEDEIEFTKEYVALEKIRFGDGLHIHFQTSPALLNCLVPKKIIQPILENAIKHGQNQCSDQLIEINIIISNSNRKINLRVENTGCLTNPGRPCIKRRTIGLNNIQRRLDLLLPGKHRFSLFEDPDHQKVICEIQLPVKYDAISLSA